MKHLTIALILPSELISLGVEKAVSHIKGHSLRIEHISADDYTERISELAPSVVIADTGVLGASDVAALHHIGVAHVIGLAINQLPQSHARAYDAVVSVYDPAETISDAIMRLDTDLTQDPQKELSPREREVVVGIVKGMSNKEIANQMNVSVNTVMTHRRNISSKLQIHSPAGLTIYAIVSNLVTMDEIKSTIS